MEQTLVLLKPGTIARGLAGEVLSRFEKKGLKIAGIKMLRMSDALVAEHYAHLVEKPFFPRIKASMQALPIIALCIEGKDAVTVVREMTGCTNSRKAPVGTIRGDYGMSMQENIVHASDSIENAEIELKRFFEAGEIFDYEVPQCSFKYAEDER